MIVTITIAGEACSSDYPCIVSQYRLDDHEWALSNVKGACLHVIADWKSVPDKIEFRIVTQEKEGS